MKIKISTSTPVMPDKMTRYTRERLVTLSQRMHPDAARNACDAAPEVNRESQNIHEDLGAVYLLISQAEHQDMGGE